MRAADRTVLSFLGVALGAGLFLGAIGLDVSLALTLVQGPVDWSPLTAAAVAFVLGLVAWFAWVGYWLMRIAGALTPSA